jgi:tRNA pseudouridine55 synthase
VTDGIVLLDKPAGQTSFRSLDSLKRAVGSGRVGHAGTLDSFAEGLLLVLTGRMTRLCAFATGLDKEYVAEVTFGRTTDTLDPEGTMTAEGPVPSREAVEAVLPGFIGTSQQLPPAYSAIHVNGRRAYEAARAGEPVVLPARQVSITSLEILGFAAPTARIRISCSKGTYVRALARDIAARLETCSYVTALRRTRIGGFLVGNAVPAEAFDPSRHILPPGAFFDACPSLGRLVLKPEAVRKASHGMPLATSFFEEAAEREGISGAFAPAGDLVAVVERTGERWSYCAVFPAEGAGLRR